MATGAIKFEWKMAGSHVTADAGRHCFFGTYSGLSLLNNDDVVNIWVSTSGGDLMVGMSGTATNNYATRFYANASMNYELLPMRAGDASRLEAFRMGSNNPVWHWTLWRQKY